MYVVHTIWRIWCIDGDERQHMDVDGWMSMDGKGRMNRIAMNIRQNYDKHQTEWNEIEQTAIASVMAL